MTDISNRGSGYSEEQENHFMEALQRLRKGSASAQLNLGHLGNQLTSSRARTFAREGMGRRLRVIERCVLNVFGLFPPGRDALLTPDECDDVAIQLHAFAINVYGLFDNLAWVLVLEAGLEIPPVKISLFKGPAEAAVPQSLQHYLKTPDVQAWFQDYGKPYRDSTAHRIPLYLPSRAWTKEDSEQWEQLDRDAMAALTSWRPGEDVDVALKRHEELIRRKNALGQNSLTMALTLTGEDARPPVFMHPQLLSDWALVQELVDVAAKSLREEKGWPAFTLGAFTLPEWQPQR